MNKRQELLKHASFCIKRAELQKRSGWKDVIKKGVDFFKGEGKAATRPKLKKVKVPKDTKLSYDVPYKVQNYWDNAPYKALNDTDRAFFDDWYRTVNDAYRWGQASDKYHLGRDRKMLEDLTNEDWARMAKRYEELPSDSYFKGPGVRPFNTPEMQQAFKDLALRIRHDYMDSGRRFFRERPDFLTGNKYVSPEGMQKMDRDWSDFFGQYEDIGQRFKPLEKDETFGQRWYGPNRPYNDYENIYSQFWYPEKGTSYHNFLHGDN